MIIGILKNISLALMMIAFVLGMFYTYNSNFEAAFIYGIFGTINYFAYIFLKE